MIYTKHRTSFHFYVGRDVYQIQHGATHGIKKEMSCVVLIQNGIKKCNIFKYDDPVVYTIACKMCYPVV